MIFIHALLPTPPPNFRHRMRFKFKMLLTHDFFIVQVKIKIKTRKYIKKQTLRNNKETMCFYCFSFCCLSACSYSVPLLPMQD